MDTKRQMNILFVTQDDPFYVKVFFEEFLKNYRDLTEIKGVVICSTLGKKPIQKLIKQVYGFYGLVGFIKMCLRLLAKKITRSGSLEHLLSKYDICSEKNNNINSQGFIDKWGQKDLDLIISVACSVIFKQPLLNLPKSGCINIHHGKLPRYRGMMPNFWQMLNNEKTAGITIHRINPKIDDGNIISQEEIEILPNETLESLIKRSKKAGANLMIKAIEMIREDSINYIKNDTCSSSYFSFPTKADVKEFLNKGKRIL